MKQLILLSLLGLSAISCQTDGSAGEGLQGNEGGSSPTNPTEERAYKRAILKCYKTGGSRVVKIEGELRCY